MSDFATHVESLRKTANYSEVDAIEKIAEKYNNSKIIFDEKDFVSVNFSVRIET